jgi:hypothetical protein
MNTISSIILTILVILILFVPRKFAVISIIVGVLFLTQNKPLELFGINLYTVRFLELAGFCRILVRREFDFTQMKQMDKCFIVFYSFLILIHSIFSTEINLYQISPAIDAFLCYFIFRGLIKSFYDVRYLLNALLILFPIFIILVSIESITGNNPFFIVGGTERAILFREGRPRCIGSFRHPVLLGTLGASFLPLYIALFFNKVNRLRSLFGISFCMWIVWLSNSGGPIASVAIGLVGWLFWFMRRKMYIIRRVLSGFIVVIGMGMNAPIWYLTDRVSLFTGGDGWHRSYLMDIAFRNIDKWWLCGMPISATSDWFPYVIYTGTADIINQYILYGLTAGLGAIGLFIILLVNAFKSIGNALSFISSRSRTAHQDEYIFWGLGVALVVHAINFFGVTYFDQFYVIWFMQLAMIAGGYELAEINARAEIA